MSIARKRILSLGLALCLLLGMVVYLPGSVEVSAAVNIGTGDDFETGPDLAGTKVYFGNYHSSNNGDSAGPILWHVVETDDNTVVLWTTTMIEERRYSNNTNWEPEYQEYWENSEICLWLNGTGSGDFLYEAFTQAEQDAIADYGIDETGHYETININQKIVLPSVAEIGAETTTGTWGISYSNLGHNRNDGRRGFGKNWWLRDPAGDAGHAAMVGDDGYVGAKGFVLLYGAQLSLTVNGRYGIRPAFRLDLSSVLFTSAAVGGKSVAVGDPLSSAEKPQSGAVKLTVVDNDQKLEDVALTGGNGTDTLEFSYNTVTATTGTAQFISCVLVDGNNEVKYYGKLEDLDTTASGTVTVPLTNVNDGDYTLKIFSEQVGGDKETDYAGGIHTFDIMVENYSGIFGSSDATLVSVARQPIIAGSETGDSNAPKTASITLDNTWSSISVSDLAVADKATAELYDAAYNTLQSSITLQDGNNELYIKVTSENKLVEVYYHVTATRQSGSPDPGPTANPSATIDISELQVDNTTSLRISLGQSGGASMATGAHIAVDDEEVVSVNRNFLDADGDVTVTAMGAGETDIRITFEGVSGYDKTIHMKVSDSGTTPPVNPPTTSSGGRSSSRDRSGSNIPDRQAAKTQLPASAFSWDADRTLTIDHERITPLGLLSVQWDGQTLTRGTDYGVYQGSVIVRFSEGFMAAQSPGTHTVRVEFLNHTGETTVSVGDTGLTTEEPNDDLFDNNTYNPNTGGYPDGSTPGIDNPNTGDGRGIWPALLLGSIGGAALVKLRLQLEVK